MSQFILFAIGCTVFVATMTGVFILGIAQFMRWEHEDDELDAITEERTDRRTTP